MTRDAFEVNIDGLVGPTHHYGGLSFGNIASMRHATGISKPRQAALQGLKKMFFLMKLGLPQLVMPPQDRPRIQILRDIGFRGTEKEILEDAFRVAPDILSACYSSSSMWTANAATISPSIDSEDEIVHFTPSNLISNFHRTLEVQQTTRYLRTLFPDENYFVHHRPLISSAMFSDEGAANHTRFCPSYGRPGIQLFVYGGDFREDDKRIIDQPRHFPSRQSYHASQAVARLHQLNPDTVVFAKQSPQAIDEGVFHNDVISVGNQDFFMYHEGSFTDNDKVIHELVLKARSRGFDLKTYCIKDRDLSIKEAVKTYLFNSQLITLRKDWMVLIAPKECEEHPRAQKVIQQMLYGDTPIQEVHYFDLRQSMRNGGGPACLRLRIVLNQKQFAAVHKGVIMTEKLYGELTDWVNRHYREKLLFKDLMDVELVQETRAAMEELHLILNI